MKARRVCNNIDYMDKKFYFHLILQAISRLVSISIVNLGLMVFFQEMIYLEQKMGRMSFLSIILNNY